MVQSSKWKRRDDKCYFDKDYFEFLNEQEQKDEKARENGEFNGEKSN